MKPRTHFSIWYVVGAFILMSLLQLYLIPPPQAEVPYSRFKQLVQEEKVKEVVIDPNLIMGTYREGEQPPGAPKYFKTVRVDDPELVKDLQAHGVQFSGHYESPWVKGLLGWVLPLLILFAIWGFVFKKMGPGAGVMTFGKSRAKLYAQENLGVTFNDVAGVDEAKEELKEIIDFLKVPQRFQALGGKIPKGVLLVGPPGTGKTLLAKAVAGEAGVPFFSMSGSDFVEMFVGVGAARVRDLFSQAHQKAPCIIFIDELDALGKARGVGPTGGHEEREQTLNQLLVEMDGFDPKKGVIIMAATNRPEILDPALLRPGRFDRHILVDRPDLKGREEILRVHTKKVKLAPGVDLKILAARTPGMVGADLANVVNEAALLAARKNKQSVEMTDFEEAIDRVMAGLEKKNRVMSDKEREIVAYHELGHAITAESLPHADPVHKVSIVPRGIAALGYTQQLPTEERFLLTRSELIDRMTVLLGGRAAEEIVFGEISTGASNDLEKASDIARRMVTEYGMSDRQGPIAFEKAKRPLFLETGYTPPKEYSEETAKEIDEEVRGLVHGCYETAKSILHKNRKALDRIAKILLQKEVLEGEELRRLLTQQEIKALGTGDSKPVREPEVKKA
ncbi:MAG: ATP-dependent zinc metalloprotease FtsH [Deltaproteobacteria bacterium]|nr:ATP-dependent zinc metalloprotease FtsH [Deltaproteobacteria bacterium]MBW2122099.1 ATP-dependent zinc metalloprotease FtsH [Deltaproteobacteria bacterium]